jgi:hypothetical protein
MNETNLVLCTIITLMLLAGGIAFVTKHIDAHNKRLLQDGKKRYCEPNGTQIQAGDTTYLADGKSKKQPSKDTGC